MSSFALDDDAPELVDSGYTPDQLDAMSREFSDKVPAWPEANFARALEIGLIDGDTVPLSPRGTAMLETPREELNRRIEALRAKIKEGMTPAEAVAAVLA